MSRLVINLHDDRPFWDIPDWATAEIRGAIPERFEVVEVATAADSRGDGGVPSDEALRAIEGAEVYFGYGFTPDLFERSMKGGRRLRWVHSGNAGVRQALFPAMVESPVVLTNSAGIHAEPIADTILGMIYHFARGFDFAVRAQARGEWDKSSFDAATMPVRELAGSTVGILGLGGIGQAVARRAQALGMRVLGHRRREAPPMGDMEVLHGEAGLQRVLRESHYVVITLPLTPETNGLLDRERIATLRSDAW